MNNWMEQQWDPPVSSDCQSVPGTPGGNSPAIGLPQTQAMG